MPCVTHTPPLMLSKLWRVPSDVAAGKETEKRQNQPDLFPDI